MLISRRDNDLSYKHQIENQPNGIPYTPRYGQPDGTPNNRYTVDKAVDESV